MIDDDDVDSTCWLLCMEGLEHSFISANLKGRYHFWRPGDRWKHDIENIF
jgi:hypothetical protein